MSPFPLPPAALLTPWSHEYLIFVGSFADAPCVSDLGCVSYDGGQGSQARPDHMHPEGRSCPGLHGTL